MNNPQDYLKSVSDVLLQVPREPIREIIAILKKARAERRRIFIFGNGGSAATASHITVDMIKSTVRTDQPRFKILCLNDSIPIVTAYSNDVNYYVIFAEPLAALAEPSDVAIALSGSGNSPNVLCAMDKAKEIGLMRIAPLACVGEVVWLSITGQWEKIPEVANRVGSSWDEVTKSSQEFINTIPEGIEQYKKMGESIRDMGDALRGVKAEQVGLNSILKLPVDMKAIIEPLQDAQKMMKNVELQGLEGPRKFQRERELSWQPYENLPKLLELNKQYMHDMCVDNIKKLEHK